MDNQTTIFLVIALIMIFVGLYLFSKSYFAKPDAPNSLTSDHDGTPVIPRDQRDTLLQQNIPAASTSDPMGDISPAESKLNMPEQTAAPAFTPDAPASTPAAEQSAPATAPVHAQVDALGDTLSSLEHATADIMPSVVAAEADSFDGNSNLLDSHLQQQEQQDQNSALHNAAEVVSLTLLPNQVLNFDGDTVLQILDAYGLKFGEMNLFHRYEEADGSGQLLFSMMRYSETDGTQPFDLQTLSDETVDGLTFFLPLPHPKASAGIGAMLSMSGSMARDLNATIYDENFEALDRKHRESLREFVTQYQA